MSRQICPRCGHEPHPPADCSAGVWPADQSGPLPCRCDPGVVRGLHRGAVVSSPRSEEWEAYSGPLCDDPAERRGLPEGPPLLDDQPDPADLVDEHPWRSPLGNEPDWADIVDGRGR